MIARMKRVTIIVPEAGLDESLLQVRDIGVLHVRTSAFEGDDPGNQSADLDAVRRAMDRMGDLEVQAGAQGRPGIRDGEQKGPEYEIASALKIVASLRKIDEKTAALRQETDDLEKDLTRLAPWGDFEPGLLRELAAAGVDIRLAEIDPQDLSRFPDEVKVFEISRTRRSLRVALVGLPSDSDIRSMDLPALSASAIGSEIASRERRMMLLERARLGLAKRVGVLRRAEIALVQAIELGRARSAVGLDGPLCHLSGYVPQRRLEALSRGARSHGWGLLIRDPGDDEEDVPTLIETRPWLGIVRPVFDFLGTVPGYREHDMSFWFLAFFSVFFAMLIGDAGYGVLFLALGLGGGFFARRRAGRRRAGRGRAGRGADPSQAARQMLALVALMGGVTVAWGAMTGTWFGVEALSRAPVLGVFVVPAISSFTDELQAGDTTRTVMHLCFIIGAVHLSIARILAFSKSLPRLKAVTHLGWVSVIWGMYFVIRVFVLGDEMHGAAIPLVLAGFVVVVLFSEQQGRLLRGFGRGLATAPLKVLDIIGAFSDVVSYVRLFAVGLATLEVAKAFNTMATGSGFGVGSILVVLLGHSLNIVLGSMALLVHGVRLNMLEFSGHLEMEWGGTAYRPLGGDTETEG